MSHFAVAVVTKDKNKIEEILEPYWEDLKVEPYIYRTKQEMIDNAKKWKKIFENKERNDFSKEFMNKYLNARTDEELYQLEKDECCEYDENGNELSTYNPKSKWDWYDIGGRWRNLLLTKIENEDTFEHNSFAEHFLSKDDIRKAPKGYKWVNGAKIKDIDFNKMNEGRDEPFYTWALVDEKGWHEQGKMGWWAMNDATSESEEAFIQKFCEYIKSEENQDKYLVIVDCHI